MREAFRTHSHTKKLNQAVDLLAVHRKNPQRYPFLLESVANGDNNCDYSILFAFPQSQIKLNQLNNLETDGVELSSNHFLDGLNEWFETEKAKAKEKVKHGSNQKDVNQLPFYGGWFVYLGYELAQEIEPVLNLPQVKSTDSVFAQTHIELPIAMATRIPAAIVVDKKNNETWIVAESDFESLLEKISADIDDNEYVKSLSTTSLASTELGQASVKEEEPERYINAVNRIQKYIIEGDVFQVNISRKWLIELDDATNSANVYAQLRKSNPAPFAGLMTVGNEAVISSSPERLVSVKNGVAETRPIAGTRPRQRAESGEIDQQADDLLRNELISHPKERAEHVMLIDLERNDLGRICKPGSIKVDELMGLESYEHVHHIVSNVKGDLADNILPGDVIRAVFPGGTITGCPKIRCMEIIAELEETPRQAYTGSMGYLNLNGDMDLNILIRTIIHSGNELHIRAGAGIVAYSDAEKELQETRVKAKGMLKVIKQGER